MWRRRRQSVPIRMAGHFLSERLEFRISPSRLSSRHAQLAAHVLQSPLRRRQDANSAPTCYLGQKWGCLETTRPVHTSDQSSSFCLKSDTYHVLQVETFRLWLERPEEYGVSEAAHNKYNVVLPSDCGDGDGRDLPNHRVESEAGHCTNADSLQSHGCAKEFGRY